MRSYCKNVLTVLEDTGVFCQQKCGNPGNCKFINSYIQSITGNSGVSEWLQTAMWNPETTSGAFLQPSNH